MNEFAELKDKVNFLKNYVEGRRKNISSVKSVDSIEIGRILDIVLSDVSVSDFVILLSEMVRSRMRKIKELKNRTKVGKISLKEEVEQALGRKFGQLSEDFNKALNDAKEYIALLVVEDMYKKGVK